MPPSSSRGFAHRDEAEQCLPALRERLTKFGLELRPDKSPLVEFGRWAPRNRHRRSQGRPETFNSLGFTHICGHTRKGNFAWLRQTMRKRMHAKLQAVKTELERRRHTSVPEQGAYLRAVIRGHLHYYYGVPRNSPALNAFRRGGFAGVQGAGRELGDI